MRKCARARIPNHPPANSPNPTYASAVDQLALIPEAKRSDSVRSMEKMTMQAAWMHDMGSDRHLKLSARLGELEDALATSESKLGEAMAHWMAGAAAFGLFEVEPDRSKRQPPSAQQAKEGFDMAVVQCYPGHAWTRSC